VVVCPHGPRLVHRRRHHELHQSALRRCEVDFDASPKLVAQLQKAQAVLNLPAGLPLISFITPDGKLYFGAGYLAAEHKNDKPSFHEAADEALARFANGSKIEEQSFQLESEK
jgi:uncharacterized protein YyaL (SSP411 family)